MDELLATAKMAKGKVEAARAKSKELREQRLINEQLWAEDAYKTFQTTLTSLEDVQSFGIAPSHGKSETPCVVVTDKANRRFEIHYQPSLLANCDYRVCAQWEKNPWYDPSVFMNKFKVAEILGRWLAETQTITDSLECK